MNVKKVDSSFDLLTYFHTCSLAQMDLFSVAVFLLMSALGLPTKAGKCPRECSCDGTKLTVTCVGKNLTEVPPTMDEVRNGHISPQICLGNTEWELWTSWCNSDDS